MESITNKQKVKTASTSRLLISRDTDQVLEIWINQLEDFVPGIRIKKRELISWLVSQKGKCLTKADLRSAKEAFYDEISRAEWIVRQLRIAKSRNEKLTLADLIRGSAAKVPKTKTTSLEGGSNGASND